MKADNFNIANCPIRNTLKTLGGKWALLILFSLREEEKRFGEIKKSIPDISEKMLIQNIKVLVLEKYMNRHDYQEIPPKVSYSLNTKGQLALPLIDEIIKLGRM